MRSTGHVGPSETVPLMPVFIVLGVTVASEVVLLWLVRVAPGVVVAVIPPMVDGIWVRNCVGDRSGKKQYYDNEYGQCLGVLHIHRRDQS